MKNGFDGEAGHFESEKSGSAVFRISEPDDEGLRFIIVLGTEGRAGPSPCAETGPFAREGA